MSLPESYETRWCGCMEGMVGPEHCVVHGKPPKPGFRWLKLGELLGVGDEFWSKANKDWMPVTEFAFGYAASDVATYIRKV